MIHALTELLGGDALPDPAHAVIAAAIAFALRLALRVFRNDDARMLFGRLFPTEFYPLAAVLLGMATAAVLGVEGGLSWGASFAYGSIPCAAMVWHEIIKGRSRRSKRRAGDYGHEVSEIGALVRLGLSLFARRKPDDAGDVSADVDEVRVPGLDAHDGEGGDAGGAADAEGDDGQLPRV